MLKPLSYWVTRYSKGLNVSFHKLLFNEKKEKLTLEWGNMDTINITKMIQVDLYGFWCQTVGRVKSKNLPEKTFWDS